MRVELTRSGGIAGLTVQVAVEGTELSKAEASKLAELVERAGVEALARRSPLRGPGADRFQYDLTVSDKGKEHRLTVSEGAVPPELDELLRWLLDRHEIRR